MPIDTRTRLLVIPDRDGAESAAEALVDASPTTSPPRVVREALAGEDDAEDAQWLVVIQAPAAGWSGEHLATLDELAAEHDGWLETED